jgi:hypothetical protein
LQCGGQIVCNNEVVVVDKRRRNVAFARTTKLRKDKTPNVWDGQKTATAAAKPGKSVTEYKKKFLCFTILSC